METKILNFDTISQGKLDAYVYVDGMYPTKGTIMDFMRKEVLTSPHTWTGKLNIQSNIQRKNMASEWYHELVKTIKNL